MPLLKAIRSISRLESSALRESVFQDIASRNVIIRCAVTIHRLCRRLGISHYLIGFYGLSYFVRARMPQSTPQSLATAVYPNEIKQLDDLDDLMGTAKPMRVQWSFAHTGGWLALLGNARHLRDVARFMRLFKKIENRLSFMPACRVAEMLFLFIRFRNWLESNRVRAVIVTSDYAPDSAALTCAAASLGIARIYMPHALPSYSTLTGRTLLDYEYYIFDSKAMHDRFANKGALGGQVIYRGIRGESRPLQTGRLDRPRLRFGIVLSGLTNLEVLGRTIAGLKRFSPERILIRGHPVTFANPDFSAIRQKNPEVVISSNTTLLQDADSCDLVIGGNTTAFLEILKYGIPAVYLSALDYQPDDYNGFVQDKLLLAIRSADALDPQAIKMFFTSAWEERLAYFDAAHSRDNVSLKQDVRRALLSWVT
jgi:hypothetical protein